MKTSKQYGEFLVHVDVFIAKTKFSMSFSNMRGAGSYAVVSLLKSLSMTNKALLLFGAKKYYCLSIFINHIPYLLFSTSCFKSSLSTISIKRINVSNVFLIKFVR